LLITKKSNNYLHEDLGNRTLLMGILNITPDSFSDGGLYLDPKIALNKAISLIEEGADVIDIGAQSTRPGARPISPEIELQRIIPVIKSIRSHLPEILISIDTFNSIVAEEALELGANWINDVSGSRLDNNILKIVSKYKCPYVITHSRGNSLTMNKHAEYTDLIFEVHKELLDLTNSALNAGVNPNKIIWDPGIGFAKNTIQNVQLIKGLEVLTNDNYPILVGPSRKKFIGEIIKEPDTDKRLSGTSAVVCKCIEKGVQIIRVHDVYSIKKLIFMADELWRK
tara:strand:+ start:2365 stop:3213 length:849 start_codon:yes stop_codon:yes gene_type:complete